MATTRVSKCQDLELRMLATEPHQKASTPDRIPAALHTHVPELLYN